MRLRCNYISIFSFLCPNPLYTTYPPFKNEWRKEGSVIILCKRKIKACPPKYSVYKSSLLEIDTRTLSKLSKQPTNEYCPLNAFYFSLERKRERKGGGGWISLISHACLKFSMQWNSLIVHINIYEIKLGLCDGPICQE